ncbi:unnamed protein product, partial [Tetraodon nigroviridis]
MSPARQPPLVTGISPKEGVAWTKVTIRGENLGTGPADLIGLSICGHNCLLTAEWMSASKIVCRVGPAKDDKGEIIVTTKSGGLGTSTVSFKLLRPERIGILDQSAVWVDEMNYYDMRTNRNKGISPLSLRPSNPLGIELDKGKIPQKDMELIFPGMSGDFTSENFSATWYLIENHSESSFEQLKVAASNLKKQATKKNEGSLAYVKGGLSTFFEAQDALSAIHQRLESDGTERVGGSMTQRLENILNRASDTADTLFQEVLGRKDKADSTRNALNVLQRFKFLFNLPLNIERNIQKTGEKSGQVEKSKKNARQRQNDFKKMIEEMTHRLVKLVRGALLPTTLPKSEQNLYGGWDNKTDLSGNWLTQIMHTVRACHEALSALEIPNDLLQVIQDLLLSLRVHCLMVTLEHTAEDVKTLAEKEDWVVDNEGITSLPSQFEQCLVQMLQSLKEPLEVKPGEINVLQLERVQVQTTELIVKILKVFINCLEQLSIRTDRDMDLSHDISVDLSSPDRFPGIQEGFSPTPEQRLLIILSNCQYLERRTILNLADHFEKHGFAGTEKITQISVEAVRQLDKNLFEAYVERRADPIAGSLEPGIYAGYFDWRDCQTPTGVRNYLKEALVTIITVHAEVKSHLSYISLLFFFFYSQPYIYLLVFVSLQVFTVSQDLVPRVLSKIIESVADEMCRLMQCVSSFSKNGALQARLEICALRDAVSTYLNPESIASFKLALDALPQLHSGADKKLLEELLNKFKSSMQLQLTCFR